MQYFYGSLDPTRMIPILLESEPNFFHPGSRDRILSILDLGCASKNLSFFSPKKWFRSFRKYDPGCSSRIWIPKPDPDFLPIPDPGSRGQKGTGSRIRIRNTAFQEWTWTRMESPPLIENSSTRSEMSSR
jgi:hypothetical protein